MRMHAWKTHVFGCQKLQKLSRIMINKISDVTVLVTGVGGAAVGNQVLKALRLAERKYRLLAPACNQRKPTPGPGALSYVVPSRSQPPYLGPILWGCWIEHAS